MSTTIQIRSETRLRQAAPKVDSRETYDSVLNKLLAPVPEGDEEGSYTKTFRVGLMRARLDIKEGRFLEHEEVKRRMGI